jgi:hypothetical protein
MMKIGEKKPRRTGVSNSNLSEGHIPEKKKCSLGRSLFEKKLLRATIYKKSPQNKI